MKKKGNVVLKGQHGYPVTDDDDNIHAIFIAHGPKFPKMTNSFDQQENRLKTFSNLELFHLFTDVLGIEPEIRDGSGALVEAIRKLKGE